MVSALTLITLPTIAHPGLPQHSTIKAEALWKADDFLKIRWQSRQQKGELGVYGRTIRHAFIISQQMVHSCFWKAIFLFNVAHSLWRWFTQHAVLYTRAVLSLPHVDNCKMWKRWGQLFILLFISHLSVHTKGSLHPVEQPKIWKNNNQFQAVEDKEMN